MGFFSKLKEGLKKTKDNIGKKIFAAFSGRALDDDFYEELEEAMLTADMGVTATEQILDEFKDEVYREKITDTEKAKNLLKRIMVDSISYDIPDYDYPLVILLAGVNGVGKRRQSANLQTILNQSGKALLWLPRTRSGRRRPNNSKYGRIARTSELSNIRKAAIPQALCLTRFRRQKPGAMTLFSWIPQDVFTTRKTLWTNSKNPQGHH